METTIIAPIREEFVSKLEQNQIIKKSQFTMPAIILSLGFIIICLPFVISGPIALTVCLIVGISMLCVGGVKWAKAPKYQYNITNKPILFKQSYFENQDKEYILNCLNGTVNPDYRFHEGTGNAILLEAYAEKDGNFVAMQVLNYVPYKYQIISGTKFFHGEQAKQLCSKLL